jgi:hypothetical protein
MVEAQSVSNVPAPKAQTRYDFEWYDNIYKNKSWSKGGLYEYLCSNPYSKAVFEKSGITKDNFEQKFDAALRDTYPISGRPIAFFISVSEEMSARRGVMELPFGASNIDHRFVVKMLQEMSDTGTNFSVTYDSQGKPQLTGIGRIQIDDGAKENTKQITINFDQGTIDPPLRVNDRATFRPENYKPVSTKDVQEFFSHYLERGRDGEILIVSKGGKFQINPLATIAPRGINMGINATLFDAKKGEPVISAVMASLLAHELIHGLYVSDDRFRKAANNLYLEWNNDPKKVSTCFPSLGIYELADPNQANNGNRTVPGHMAANEFMAYVGTGSINLNPNAGGCSPTGIYSSQQFLRNNELPVADFSKLAGRVAPFDTISKALGVFPGAEQTLARFYDRLNHHNLAGSIEKFLKMYAVPEYQRAQLLTTIADYFRSNSSELIDKLIQAKVGGQDGFAEGPLVRTDSSDGRRINTKAITATLQSDLGRYAPEVYAQRIASWEHVPGRQKLVAKAVLELTRDHYRKSADDFAKTLLGNFTGKEINQSDINVVKAIFHDLLEVKSSKNKITTQKFFKMYSEMVMAYSSNYNSYFSWLETKHPEKYERLLNLQKQIAFELQTGSKTPLQ